MKLNTGKFIKIIAIILGVIGIIICLSITLLRSTSFNSSSSNLSTARFMGMYNILLLSIYVFIVVFICAVIYGIGQIIELLHKINLSLPNFTDDKKSLDINQTEESIQPIIQINPEISQIDKDTMWKRPISENNTLS